MKPQRTKSKEQKKGSTSTSIGNTSLIKCTIPEYIDTALMIGFSHKEAIQQLHSIGMYITK